MVDRKIRSEGRIVKYMPACRAPSSDVTAGLSMRRIATLPPMPPPPLCWGGAAGAGVGGKKSTRDTWPELPFRGSLEQSLDRHK